ncbi:MULTISPECIES: response regulator transcription factor [Paenibacillus]|uniref:Response regulator n=1 Tax=Paenibacillus violae TaxID=3077234 RepID=A0ABU3RCT2_9BACL|nr:MULTISPECIES: response regulator [Paenibacillus]MDU0202069.1 response regulator [Paenibacillus sp. PFR10]MEC0270335.1 response regulator [Paenibacillus anseongense]
MCKVLFVDDEPIALEGIRMLADWEGLGFEVCGMCSDGEEALRLIINCRPSLVITDIRMSVIDGLELIRQTQLLSETYRPIFIIMSGYGDFKYAQSALRYGVRHYLLKPIMDDEWEITLGEVMEELASRQQVINRQEMTSGQLFSMMIAPILRGELEGLDESISKQIGELDQEAKGWRCILIEGMNEEELASCSSYIVPPKAMLVDLMPGQICLVVDCAEDVRELAGKVYNGLRQHGVAICVSIGPPVRFLRDLNVSYSGALEASVHHFFYDSEGLVDYETADRLEFSYNLGMMATLEELLGAAERLQEQEAASILKQVFALFQNDKIAPEMVRMLCVHVVLKSMDVLRELEVASMDMWPMFRNLLQTGPKSLTTLEQSVWSYLAEYMRRLRERRESSSGHPLYGIERYIQENYKSPLTIKEIGKRFYMNPVYLGHAFVKKYGVGIIEYIHDLRINEAKNMLTESAATIRSIAEGVGYVHYHHFLREFEKRVQEKPVEYREKNAE